MKLSDAIILGTTLGPQIFCKYFDDEHKGSCALGSAFLAVGTTPAVFPFEWEWAREYKMSSPCGCTGDRPVDAIIVHLNDIHEWTRERIAEWVRTVEPASAWLPETKEIKELTTV